MSNKYLAINLIIFASLFITGVLTSSIIKDAEVTCSFNRAGYKICKSLKTLVEIEKVNLDLDDDQEIDIVDKSISSMKPGVFNHLNITKLSLKLTDGQLDLKPDGFVGLSGLKSLEINSGIVHLEPRIFAGLESLRSLTLTINGARQDFKRSLPELVLLENLIIINSNLTNVNSQTFHKLYPAIKRLDLSSNNITKIGTDAFSTLLSLSTLIINKNNLVNIQEGVFDGMDHLLHLEITSNKLTTIERKMFRGLARLETLDLSDNLITHIGDKSFNGLNISTLLLSNNKLKTIKHGIFNDIKSLKAINLNNNRISSIERYAFSNLILDKLNLNYNNITFVGENYFEGLFVDVMDLSRNKIDTIARDAFKKSRIMSIIVDKYLEIIKTTWGFTSLTNITQV